MVVFNNSVTHEGQESKLYEKFLFVTKFLFRRHLCMKIGRRTFFIKRALICSLSRIGDGFASKYYDPPQVGQYPVKTYRPCLKTSFLSFYKLLLFSSVMDQEDVWGGAAGYMGMKARHFIF